MTLARISLRRISPRLAALHIAALHIKTLHITTLQSHGTLHQATRTTLPKKHHWAGRQGWVKIPAETNVGHDSPSVKQMAKEICRVFPQDRYNARGDGGIVPRAPAQE
ncbi:MAG TPA: hypothetical protein VHX65_06295 [Pirellulales bacterium]|jgi:hypothetical protein|nr:hypothetical protein [Pirellulales bacterium]